MKILIIANELPCRSETFILKHVEALLERGHKVTVLAGERCEHEGLLEQFGLEWGESLKDARYPAIPNGILPRIIATAVSLLRGLTSPQELYRLCKFSKNPVLGKNLRIFALSRRKIRDFKEVDVVHCHFASSSEIYRFLYDVGAVRAPSVVHFHGIDVHGFPRMYGDDCYSLLKGYPVNFIANSGYTAKKAAELVHVGEADFKIIKEYVDLSRFVLKARKLDASGVIQITSVGRLVEKKGHVYALKAMRKLAERGVNVQYNIIGDGPLMESLQKTVNSLQLCKVVTLHGHLSPEEVARVLARSHISLTPSVTAENGDMEGQGVVIQEAQAMGIPVIATYHNGFSESLIEGETGFMVPERDSLAIADTIVKLISMADDWEQMGEAGCKFVNERFSPSLLTEQHLANYEGLI